MYSSNPQRTDMVSIDLKPLSATAGIAVTIKLSKTKQVKITLITCTYNAESVLQRTLDSVLRQPYADIEHIIIDGASSDSTVAIAEKYKAQSDKMQNGHAITILSEPDNGLYDAMNKGIGMATGAYLCFLNAGDMLTDDAIRKFPSGRSVVYGETDIVDDNGNFLRHRRLQAPEKLTWRSFRNGMLVCHQAFYANTELAKCTPYNLKYRISGDVDWCIRIMKEGEKRGMTTWNTHRVLCRYLAGGMSVKNHRASLLERFHTMREHYGIVTTVAMHAWFVIRGFIKK
ncbi:glycosyltransferase family 2 protein [Palleniella intestinalis]|uniref:glycosyltransferase family 2 protein n=1 Tax=Palleniella intestinalis TaxID=2736291 RepID=UPI0020A62937|nr:glycosyltransferase family 2 protein [Palleniella intestinalis]